MIHFHYQGTDSLYEGMKGITDLTVGQRIISVTLNNDKYSNKILFPAAVGNSLKMMTLDMIYMWMLVMYVLVWHLHWTFMAIFDDNKALLLHFYVKLSFQPESSCNDGKAIDCLAIYVYFLITI